MKTTDKYIGLDVHKDTIVITDGGSGQRRQACRERMATRSDRRAKRRGTGKNRSSGFVEPRRRGRSAQQNARYRAIRESHGQNTNRISGAEELSPGLFNKRRSHGFA